MIMRCLPFLCVLLLVLSLLTLGTDVHAEQLIHFDCVADGLPETPVRPQSDKVNTPPNNLQCIPTNSSVLGMGTIHPDLEIQSPSGNTVLKNRTGVSASATHGAPNDAIVDGNCFEFLDLGRVENAPPPYEGGWGFGDKSVCAGGTCGGPPAKAEFDFVFHNITVNAFSIRMLDWGDFHPQATYPDNFQVTLTAFDASNSIVDTFNYHFSVSTVSPNGNSDQNPFDFVCVDEANNSCVGPGSDLWFEGDACTANDTEPGYLTLAVQGAGITHLELRVPSNGFDSNVSFDSIRFTEEEEPDLDVKINVHPYSWPNPINSCSGGVTPVIIWGAENFLVERIDINSLIFADSQVKVVGKSDKTLCEIEDVGAQTNEEGCVFVDGCDGIDPIPDGFLDLSCKFETFAMTAVEIDSKTYGVISFDYDADGNGSFETHIEISEEVKLIKECE